MKINEAKKLLEEQEKERKENYEQNAQYIVQKLSNILDNEDIVVTPIFEKGVLHIKLTNKNYKGLRLFQPKVFVVVSWENVEEKKCYYRYTPFLIEYFSTKNDENLAKFIVYLYKKLCLVHYYDED